MSFRISNPPRISLSCYSASNQPLTTFCILALQRCLLNLQSFLPSLWLFPSSSWLLLPSAMVFVVKVSVTLKSLSLSPPSSRISLTARLALPSFFLLMDTFPTPSNPEESISSFSLPMLPMPTSTSMYTSCTMDGSTLTAPMEGSLFLPTLHPELKLNSTPHLDLKPLLQTFTVVCPEPASTVLIMLITLVSLLALMQTISLFALTATSRLCFTNLQLQFLKLVVFLLISF
ncbi:hypothetical protein C8Q75DRAFT_528570 [Abortiporus biennis]|nr:hypothetical protein C8Q75DRAFT_528570 [Abortiporus biennis]